MMSADEPFTACLIGASYHLSVAQRYVFWPALKFEEFRLAVSFSIYQ